MEERRPSPLLRRAFPVVSLLFLLSGATALMYEVIWVRLLALTFGNTAYAIGTVIAAFMSGLSIGSFFFGRWADRGGNLLRAYGILEIGIALFALFSPFLLGLASALYLAADPASLSPALTTTLRYGLSFAVLLLPTTLMGGTLPILSRHFISRREQLERRLGLLYAINTLGGVVGTLVVGFFLIRLVGMSASLRIAAAVNLAIGIFSLVLASFSAPVSRASSAGSGPARKAAGKLPFSYYYALGAFFFSSGLAAMIYEVAWSRILVEVIGSATYSFSIILMGFLLGIAFGSLAVSMLSGRRRLGLVHFSLIELALGATGLATLMHFRLLPSLMQKGILSFGGSYAGILTFQSLLVLSYLVVPTTLFGMTFPIIASVFHRCGREGLGRDIGLIYAFNTAGAIIGSLCGAFLLLPLVGSSVSVRTAAAINFLVGAAGLLAAGRRKAGIAAAALTALPLLPLGIPDALLDTGVAIYGKYEDFSLHEESDLIFFREGVTSTISVRQLDGGILALRTNGKADAGTNMDDMRTQLALGFFPTMLHPDPRSVLVIGMGSGITVKAVRESPEVKEIDCVEIEPAVMEAAGYFSQYNGRIHEDPAVRYIVDDARSHIVSSGKKYDVIISEPSNPWISGIGNLYTREFFRTAAGHLREGGIYCQWVQIYNLRGEDFKMILKTFSSIFPDATVWQSNLEDLLIIGSADGSLRFDPRTIGQRLAGERGGILKFFLNIRNPLDFFAYHVTGSAGVARISSGGRLNTDDLPLLEFNAPLALYADTIRDNYLLLMKELTWPSIPGVEEGRLSLEELHRRRRIIYGDSSP